MNFITCRPTPPLDQWIAFFWLLTDAPAHARERIVPAGTLELVVNLHEDAIEVHPESGGVRRLRGAVVSGAYARSFMVDTRAHASLLGVHFQPGGARAFLGAHAHEFSDAHIDLADVWTPAAADALRDALCNATTPAARFAIMHKALSARLVPALAGRRCTEALLLRPGRPIRDVAREMGTSHRSFIRAFAAETGLPPKLFLRIRRFHAAFELAGASGGHRWADIAARCGYYDQSHLIRDFVEFAGITPAACARLPWDRVKPDHLPIH